ncbi:Tat pathway signal protein [Streptomyces sp. ISL-14]|nr:Tat pathway signal protein [Streptomyces sp. ISL-14]
MKKKVLASLAILGIALTASIVPAEAKTSDGWIRGYDGYGDDLDDEGMLNTYTFENSNAACFWQKILWAEGAEYDSDGNKFKFGMVDGIFGPKTSQATKELNWRIRRVNSSDVTGDILYYMGNKLVQTGGSTARGKDLYLEFRGEAYTFRIKRNSEGKYTFDDRYGNHVQAGYRYRTCQ